MTTAKQRSNGWTKPVLSGVVAVVVMAIGGGIAVRDQAQRSELVLAQVRSDLNEHEKIPAHPQMDRNAARIQSTLENLTRQLGDQDQNISRIDNKIDRLIELQLRQQRLPAGNQSIPFGPP